MFVNMLHRILQNNAKPTMQEIEDKFDATICRCTGEDYHLSSSLLHTYIHVLPHTYKIIKIMLAVKLVKNLSK